MENNLVHIAGLNKSYSTVRALEDVDLALKLVESLEGVTGRE